MPALNTELKDQIAVVIDDPDNGLVEIGKENKPAIRLILAIVGGPCEGHTIEWIGWLTDAAFESTLKRLQDAFQFSGNFGEVAEMPALFAGQQCRITTEFETYENKTRLKVKWLNSLAGGGGAAPVMEPAKAKSLASKLTARAAALMKAAGTKPPAAPSRPAGTGQSGAAGFGPEDEIPS